MTDGLFTSKREDFKTTVNSKQHDSVFKKKKLKTNHTQIVYTIYCPQRLIRTRVSLFWIPSKYGFK